MTRNERTAQETRAAIMEAAHALILEDGYEKATMRAIAKTVGLSPPAAYNYFKTKEHIVYAFYKHAFEEYLSKAWRIVAESKSLDDVLWKLLSAQFKTLKPYHGVLRPLLRAAVDLDSALSPFSEESASLRDRSFAIYKALLERHAPNVLVNTNGATPFMLWVFHTTMITLWVCDKTPGQMRTRCLAIMVNTLMVSWLKKCEEKMPPLMKTLGLDVLERFPIAKACMDEHSAQREDNQAGEASGRPDRPRYFS